MIAQEAQGQIQVRKKGQDNVTWAGNQYGTLQLKLEFNNIIIMNQRYESIVILRYLNNIISYISDMQCSIKEARANQVLVKVMNTQVRLFREIWYLVSYLIQGQIQVRTKGQDNVSWVGNLGRYALHLNTFLSYPNSLVS